MSSRRNYLDADNSIMERNLRFVKNDLEDNLNQYFGGSGSRGNNSTTVTAPPRDYKVVQPKPGGSHAQAQSFGLEKRRGFLLQLGLARHEAYELAKNSDFDVNRYEEKCEKWLDSGIRQAEINHKILSEIRNENTWNNDYEMSSKTPTVPFTATCIEERDNLNRDRGYSQIYEERSCRNRSRSRSHPYDPQSKDYREERHPQSISRSPNRGLSSMYERKNEEYFSQQLNSREAVKRDVIREGSGPRLYSPPRSDRRGERYQLSRSRSPNRAINTMRERKNEEYVLQHDNFRPEVGRDTMRKRSRSYSPPTTYRREERIQLSRSRSRSPNRGFSNRDDEEYYVRQDNYTIDLSRDTIHEKSHLPPRNDIREERYQSARSRSPNRGFNLMQERESEMFLIERDNFRTIRERSSSRPYSPPRHDRREELYQSTRSRSPIRGLIERNPSEYFSQPENFRKTIRERSRSRAYSPPINDRREEFYQSSNSRSPNRALNSRNNRRSEDFREEIRMDFAPSPSTATRFPSENKNKYGNIQKRPNGSRNIPTQQNREIPSLLALDTFPTLTKSSHAHNIPSLLTLQVFPDQSNVQQPSTSGKGNRYNNESNRKQIPKYGNNKQTKFNNNNKGKTQQMKKEPNANSQCLREHVSKIPIIQCGLAKPPPGHLKANPKEYWSQWWPQYKYIEYSVPKINPKDNEVKTCINFMFKPHELEFRRNKNMLLGKGVNAIMKTVDINETNYYVRDIYKLFKYKKHLEDPNFLNNLAPQDLNCIAPALRQFKIKSTMAFLHQALICRWHISLDIIKKVQAGEPIRSNYARILLNEKCFHYLVMESIQELKKMCQQDWPQFAEFYKNIRAAKVDIHALGVGPNLEASNAKSAYKPDDDDEYDDSY
ncbi:uncharacterized protein DDB_G0283697 isoform X1 [Calliphora vicina]|uniref:uncharacterized protein DDB_G0283697 isoform X1 n=1 Tax=Calliphora vicina TaxID=7373 RepID=UPI00325B2A84